MDKYARKIHRKVRKNQRFLNLLAKFLQDIADNDPACQGEDGKDNKAVIDGWIDGVGQAMDYNDDVAMYIERLD
jgi:hypothetical protein